MNFEPRQTLTCPISFPELLVILFTAQSQSALLKQCEKYSSRGLILARFEILDDSMFSFVQESIQGKISKSTPTKATLVKKRSLKTADPQVGASVIAFDQKKQQKVFSESFRIWARDASNVREGK